METKLNFKNFKLKRGYNNTSPHYLEYTHKNGYIQTFIMDEFDGPFIEQYQYFKNLIKMGTNKLYHAYSLLPFNLINKNGDPEINLTFEQAQQYIISGCLPSSEQLQENEANKNKLIIDGSI